MGENKRMKPYYTVDRIVIGNLFWENNFFTRGKIG